jgi:hypothetical protein
MAMRDCEELVKALRLCASNDPCDNCLLFDDRIAGEDHCNEILIRKAADAIEELVSNADKFKWIMVESRPMDEEERKEWSERIGYDLQDDEAVIYTSELPDDGQEVIVCSKWGHVWLDTFSNDPDYGVGFEGNGDMDGIVAWMPLPEPPKEDGNA